MEISNKANLPTKNGNFIIQSFMDNNNKEHLVVYHPDTNFKEPVNVRIHSECLTGDVFSSLKCDCQDQLNYSIEYIKEHTGMVIYHKEEGRGIGLFNKVNAYSLQDKGLDTIQANLELGFKVDQRDFSIVNDILNEYGIKKIKLMTNNPEKIKSITSAEIIDRIEVIIPHNEHNTKYLKTKKEELNHKL